MSPSILRVFLLAFVGSALALLLALSALTTPCKISPQGCRMSWMSPSYILQNGLNASWTSPSLAHRYKLLLYREVGWDSNDELRGVPVLFIPGNAGSAHQVRSIASSATRQYYSSQSYMNPYFTSRGIKPLDFFAVDFNEDLSAFHGPTLESEQKYTAAAVNYILSLYPTGTKIILMGHSMGGIVGLSLLPAGEKVSSVITMSTPHSIPPARFDARMDDIYSKVREQLENNPTPILSICGGITDTMIPSEFCTLPEAHSANVFRKTVFSSGLEGCWTGVGHREMVWCHQVRWRIARAALELGTAETTDEMGLILAKWFEDGSSFPISSVIEEHKSGDFISHTIPDGQPLVLREPMDGQAYDFLLSEKQDGQLPLTFVAYVSRGSILSVAPFNALPLKVSMFYCRRKVRVTSSDESELASCGLLTPSSLKLIPNPVPGELFPLPHEGIDESEGVVMFKAIIPVERPSSQDEWVSLRVQNEGREGWVIASIENQHQYISHAGAFRPIYGTEILALRKNTLHTSIKFTDFLSNVLLVYRAIPRLSSSCNDPLLSPLLHHASGPSEGHYHRLQNNQSILLHGHSSAPYLNIPPHLRGVYTRGLNLSIYSSENCSVDQLIVTVDWWNSFGRWGARYWNAVLAWGAGVIAYMFYSSWLAWDSGAPAANPIFILSSLTNILPKAMSLSFLISLLPLSSGIWLGNVGESTFAPLAPFILLVSSGLVCLTWLLLVLLLTPYGALKRAFSRLAGGSAKDTHSSYRGGIATILLMSALVFVLVPWQVAFLAYYLIHFHHCASFVNTKATTIEKQDSQNQKLLVLLMMTWCLPVVAPVLAVWVRTLMTAGYTTPFDGDHFVLNVLSFMVLTYLMTTSSDPVFQRRHRLEIIPVPYFYALGSFVIFFLGPRSTFRMYEALNWPTFFLLLFRVVPKAWAKIEC